nr:spore germination protein [Bacillus subtilis]
MFKLYLDPGHGRMDLGAIGNGMQEKEITLNISHSIRNLLENHYEGLQIKMSRTADITRSLKERTDDANAFGTGAKDGFVEEVGVNVALIRKRIKSTSMVYETKKVGVRTKTTVAILYMRDIVDPKIVQDVKNKLDDLHIDGAFSATQLEELMELTKALFPLMGYTGRADFTVNCMLNGRVALIVDGTPAALIAPANLFLLVKAPEDIHFTALAATFGQTLRLLGLSVSLLLPAFFVAILSYHQDQLPYYLLATLGINRLGIPCGS